MRRWTQKIACLFDVALVTKVQKIALAKLRKVEK